MPIAPDLPTVEGYTVESKIETGGFATVYRAIQHDLDRPVAIKVLHDGFSNDDQRRLFQKECRVMGQLSRHEGIVTVFQAITTAEGLPGIVMELYDGTLRDRETLDPAAVVDVGVRVADALALIHEQGIVHRDIKPHNVFVNFGGRGVAVGDFGISSIQSERTLTGGAGFSIDYSPPEVFEEGGTSFAGDIYSLGATLYHLTTGRVPFPSSGSGDRLREVAVKILRDPVVPLDQGFPRNLDWILRRAMSKRPSDRQHTAAELGEELRRLQSELGLPRSPIPPLAVAAEASPRSPEWAEPPGSRSTEGRGRGGPSQGGTLVRNRNIGIAEHDPQSGSPAEQAEPAAPTANRRRDQLLVWVALVAALAVIGLGVGIIASRSGDEPTVSDSGRADRFGPTDDSVNQAGTSVVEFTIVAPPSDLTVGVATDGFEVTWTEDDPALSYQVHVVGRDESKPVDAPPFRWPLSDGASTACFEVRTISADGKRLSQTAAGPVCASHP